MRPKKVAIVAEWLTWRGGAESVLDALLEAFPEAQLFTTVYSEKKLPEYKKFNPRTSFLQKVPIVRDKHQVLPPVLLQAIRSLDLSGYDLIISSSSAIGKGIRKPEGAIHVCYCHTPMRYVWQSEIDKRLVRIPGGRLFLNYLKRWDLKTNESVDYFLTNSQNMRRSIKQFYNRDATVIYPPVDVDSGKKFIANHKKDFYLILGRLIPYKRFDIAINAFNSLERKLVVAGEGPELEKLKRLAKSKNIEFVGRVDKNTKWQMLRAAKALIFPGDEDFGIVPVEAMSVGTPVIAFGKGGALETVISGKTGVLFERQTPESLSDAVKAFEKVGFNEYDIRNMTDKFSANCFKTNIKKFIDNIKEKNGS